MRARWGHTSVGRHLLALISDKASVFPGPLPFPHNHSAQATISPSKPAFITGHRGDREKSGVKGRDHFPVTHSWGDYKMPPHAPDKHVDHGPTSNNTDPEGNPPSTVSLDTSK